MKEFLYSFDSMRNVWSAVAFFFVNMSTVNERKFIIALVLIIYQLQSYFNNFHFSVCLPH